MSGPAFVKRGNSLPVRLGERTAVGFSRKSEELLQRLFRLEPGFAEHGLFLDAAGLLRHRSVDLDLADPDMRQPAFQKDPGPVAAPRELALELVSRGHGLVADDVVDLSRIAPHTVEGRCPPLLRNLLEVRGLGLLDIRTIFGETAVRPKMKLKLIVHLVRRSTMENEYQRLPLEALTQEVLGVPIRKVVIPVAAGRNLAVLAEAAVRSTVLQLRGFDTMGDFVERQRQMIETGGG